VRQRGGDLRELRLLCGQALITFTQAQANRSADTAALFQALGGEWWNRTDIQTQ
jgi:hypothetical protein